MATKQLKRMNRFELLELMYELVRENEKLRRKCERLEGRGGADEWDDTAYSRSVREKARAEPEGNTEARTRMNITAPAARK